MRQQQFQACNHLLRVEAATVSSSQQTTEGRGSNGVKPATTSHRKRQQQFQACNNLLRDEAATVSSSQQTTEGRGSNGVKPTEG